MKVKKIGIVHTGDFNRIGVVEKVFTELIELLESEGRCLDYIGSNVAVFRDGSTISKFKLGGKGVRHTHLYIDSEIFNLENGEDIALKSLLPTVIPSGDYEHLDAKSSESDRIYVISDNGAIIKPIL